VWLVTVLRAYPKYAKIKPAANSSESMIKPMTTPRILVRSIEGARAKVGATEQPGPRPKRSKKSSSNSA